MGGAAGAGDGVVLGDSIFTSNGVVLGDGTLFCSGVVLGDGRNESISYSALATGLYRVRVVSEGGGLGEYAVSVTGPTPIRAKPPSPWASTIGASSRGNVT